MRYVPINQLKEGMILGQELTSGSDVLLEKNTTLSDENISYIAFLGIPGVYIDDEFSKEAVIENVVEAEVRKEAISAVQDVFIKTSEDTPYADELEFSPEEERIQKIVEDIVNNILENKDVMINLMDLKTYDNSTFSHSASVAVLSGIIGVKCKISDLELESLVMAGFLHDIGKVFIDQDVINAPRRLTSEERDLIMNHPRMGFDFLVNHFHFPNVVTQAVYEHHEWFNGEGYPRQKEKNNIMFISKILKAADVYQAMTSNRPYHAPFLPSEVMEYIMSRSGTEFDPRIVRIMSKELCIYPVGCEVELSSGQRAIVIKNHHGFTLRPTVKTLDTGEVMDLSEDRTKWNLTIKKLIV